MDLVVARSRNIVPSPSPPDIGTPLSSRSPQTVRYSALSLVSAVAALLPIFKMRARQMQKGPASQLSSLERTGGASRLPVLQKSTETIFSPASVDSGKIAVWDGW